MSVMSALTDTEGLKTHLYLTIMPRARVGYEMIDIIISYSKSTSGIIALLKTSPRY